VVDQAFVSDGLTIRVVRIRENAVLPTRAYASDAAFDLTSAVEEQIPPGGRALIMTGLRIAVPQGYVALVLPRSGLALRSGVTVLNAPGCIDPGYRGEVGVLLINTGASSFAVRPGDRVAQVLVSRSESPMWVEGEVLPASERGAAGFGSTDSA
jgi:dUTP diphosphatase